MLTQKGQLTDIGSWYLGGAATNNIPQTTGDVSSSVRVSGKAWLAAVAGFVGLLILV